MKPPISTETHAGHTGPAHQTLFPAILLALAASVLPGCSQLGTTHPGPPSLGPPTPEQISEQQDAIDRLESTDGRLSVPAVIDPGHAAHLAAEARSQRYRGQENEALRTLLDGLEDPGLDAEGLALLASLLEHEGRAELALAARQTAIDRQPSPERHRQLAAQLSRMGRWHEAVLAWTSVLELAPGDSRSRGRLAVAQHFAGTEVESHSLDAAPPTLRALVATGSVPRARIRRTDKDTARILGDERRVDSGAGSEASEVTLVAYGNQLTAAWNDLRQADATGPWRIGVGTSHDFGETWTDRILRHPNEEVDAFEGDPMSAVDKRTGHRWIGGIQFFTQGGVYVAHQHPNGVIDPPVTVFAGSTDKCWMAAGAPPGAPDSTRVYVAYNFPNALQRSTDLGTTWSSGVDLDVDGIGFLPRVAPDGLLYLGYTEFPDLVFAEGVMLQISSDGGESVGAPQRVVDRMDAWDVSDSSRFPGQFRVPPLPILAISPVDGTLYFAYMDTTSVQNGQFDVDLYLVSSSDGGTTWTTPTIIAGGPETPGDQLMAWLEVDDSGGLHMVYFDTGRTVQSDGASEAHLDLVYSTSRDGGASWTERLLTDAPFSTAGIEWPNQGQFVGDYLGMAIGDDRLWVAYPRVDDQGTDLDIFSRRIAFDFLFEDGFESGSTVGWTLTVP